MLVLSVLDVGANVTLAERTTVYDVPVRDRTSTVPSVVIRPPPAIAPCRTRSRLRVPATGTSVVAGPATCIAVQVAVPQSSVGTPSSVPMVTVLPLAAGAPADTGAITTLGRVTTNTAATRAASSERGRLRMRPDHSRTRTAAHLVADRYCRPVWTGVCDVRRGDSDDRRRPGTDRANI